MSETDDNQLPLFTFEESNIKTSITECEEKGIESPFSKYVVYVDESGDHSLQSVDENYPIFVLALCVFHKRHYSEAIVPALEKFKFNHFGHDQVVLHENSIRKEKPPFNIFKSKEEREGFIGELTGIIEGSNFITICCVIEKNRLLAQEDTNSNPYHIALVKCLEKLQEFLLEKNQHEKTTHLVVECRGKKEDAELELEIRRICDGNNRKNLKLPYEIIFSDKKAMSSGLQLADLVARPIGINYLRSDQGNRAFEVLREKFYCDGGRENVGKDYKDVGLLVFPTPESEKPR